MSATMKFGIVAAVVIGVVLLGYYLHKRQQIASLEGLLNEAQARSGPRQAKPDDAFAKNADGSADYTRKKDGTPIRLG